MEQSDIIVGLDIGTTKIAAIVGRLNELGKIEILGFGKTDSYGVRRGMVNNIENTVAGIQQVVELAGHRANVDINSVYVSIAGQHIKSQQHQGHIIRDNREDGITQEEIDRLTNDMYKLVINPGEQIIEVIPQEYTVDGETGIKAPRGVLGSKLEANFHIITGQTLAAKNIIKCVESAKLTAAGLILEPIASAEAVLSEEEKEAGVALVDIGGGTTDLAIFQDNLIRYTAVIPLGGDIVTEDIKKGCSIIKRHAEELKVRFGSSVAKENKDEEIVTIPGLQGRPSKEITLRNLAGIIQSRMTEIIDHVCYEIRNSGYEDKLIGGIVLTGGGSQLKHLAQLTSFITGMDVRIGYPSQHLANDLPKELGSPMFATGVGLVMLGIQQSEEKRKKKDYYSSKSTSGSGQGGKFFNVLVELFKKS